MKDTELISAELKNSMDIRSATNHLTKNQARVTAILVDYMFVIIRELKDSLATEKPTANEREFKMLNRYLKKIIDDHDRLMTYKLKEWHRMDIKSGLERFMCNTALSKQLMYFQVRNEVINSDIPESCYEPVIKCRCLELTINIVDSIMYKENIYLGRRFVDLLDILRCVCNSWTDKGGQQELCRKIIQIEIERMLKEEDNEGDDRVA